MTTPPKSVPFLNLSPSEDRIGGAAAWIEREDGRVLMVGLEWEWGGWTLPGGGIHPGETPQQAAVREAWEEAAGRYSCLSSGYGLIAPPIS